LVHEHEKVDKSWLGWFLLIFVMTKIVVIIFLLLKAILHHGKKRGKFHWVTVMLLMNVGILICFAYMKLGPKKIPFFFTLIILSNYMNFRGFIMLTRGLKTPEGKDL